MERGKENAPPIKCGYCGVIVNAFCEDILQHECLENYHETMTFINIDENFVVTMIPKESDCQSSQQTTNSKRSADEVDELLIHAVSMKPALYNYTLPASDRSKLKKAALWQEVSNMIGRCMDVDDVQKRWKYLRDCYVKAKKQEKTYIPSGSGAATAKKNSTFRFYEIMTFLNDSLERTPTVSNFVSPGPSSLQPSEMDPMDIPRNAAQRSPCTPSPSSTVPMRRPSRTPTPTSKYARSEDRSAIQAALLSEFNAPHRETDAVDGFLMRLGEGLRKLPYRERSLLEIKFLSLLMAATDKLASDQ